MPPSILTTAPLEYSDFIKNSIVWAMLLTSPNFFEGTSFSSVLAVGYCSSPSCHIENIPKI
jgi:hypothetical protein